MQSTIIACKKKKFVDLAQRVPRVHADDIEVRVSLILVRELRTLVDDRTGPGFPVFSTLPQVARE